jgi:hypothetical protein
MRLLLPIIAIGIVILCLTLFFEGLVGKREGREAEEAMQASFRKLERKSDANAGRAGDWTKRFLAWLRRRGQGSASRGRKLRRKIAR